ncbi:uncharacterized protein LOC141774574 isoform X1 [Sebastes fasciatus]|uniref:uncharacterized protein LOC141774574 isoform X1 n=1 Tax=Sebastes fasciatus TaxID=394691 RepID=UPI003D9E7067
MMAAALIRRGTGLCCIHRELCRVVWRSQTALFSSKPSDKNQPRKTHIKKAKPQPAVDVAKLLEEIFSQQRPGTAPPAGKARPAKASSIPTKPPTTSSVNVSTSNIPPLSKTNARSLSNVTVATTSGSSPTSSTPAAIEHQPSAETIETKVETATVLPLSAHEVEKNAEASSFPAATVEPLIETTIESPVDHTLSSVETVETRAAVVEGPVEPTVDAPAEAIQTKDTDSGVAKEDPLIETTIESPVEAVETLETRAAVVGGPVEPTIDVTVDAAAQEVETNSTDSGVVDISHTAAVEPVLESTVEPPVEASPLETLESGAAVVECPVEPSVDAAAQAVETKSTGPINLSHTAKEETTIETPVEAVEALETRAAVVEGPVEPTIDVTVDAAAHKVETNSTDSGPVYLSHTAKEEPLIEITIESPVEASHFPVETLETKAAVVEGPVEPTIDVTVDAAAQEVDSGVVNISYSAKEEPLIETTIETSVDASTSPVSEGTIEPTIETEAVDNLSHTPVIQNAHESAPLPSKIDSTVESCSVNEEVSRSEEMTLESVTLHVDQVLVASLKTDELLRTKSILDEKAEKQLQESSVRTEIGAESESEDSSDDEGENLNKVLSKWDSLSEDLQELEGESGALVKELLFHVPATLSKTRSNAEQTEEKATEAMTLESVTLSEVTADVGGLDTEALLEAMNALEKEADVLAKEEKMEVTTTMEDVAEFEDEMLTLDSISEATDAIEAVMLEVMLGSEQGPRQPLEGQEAEEESGESERGSVVEAMSLESVTLAEVEASLGTLEDESLSETADYLEKEAEIVAGEKKVEVEEDVVASEETTLEIESLPEDLQIDALMEELLFSVPGHVTGVTEGQEVVGADVLDEMVVVGSVDVDTAAEVTDDVPAQKEVLLKEEFEEEEGAQAEASGSEDVKGTHADLDPVQRLFLEKIREYNNMHRLNGGLLEAEPGYEKLLSEETAKLQRLYGGGDLSSFPQFTFTEPETDQDSK